VVDIYYLNEYRKKRDMKRRPDIDSDRLAKIEKSNKESQEQSHQAWANLKRNKTLGIADRKKIARRLHREVDNLLRIRPDLKKWQICQEAGFTNSYERTSQELSYLTIPDSSRLRSTRAPYRSLIKAIATLSGKNLFRLVDEMTIGTEIHPLHGYVNEDVDSIDNPQVVIATLHEAIDRIDREHHIYESYRKTADVIAKRFKKGSVIRWPFTDFVSPDRVNQGLINAKDIFWRNTYCQESYSHDAESMVAIMSSGALLAEGEFLPYVPHVYLGTQYTFDWAVTLSWDRYAWPYPDNCGEECPCDECKDALPCLPWERGICFPPDRWSNCLERKNGRSGQLLAEQETGRRLLSVIQEPLRFDETGIGDGHIDCLVDGRSLSDVYDAVRRERLAMFDECGQIIHPAQAVEFIRYLVKNPGAVDVSKEMLEQISSLVDDKYEGDYPRFAAELEKTPLKDEWKKRIQGSIDEMKGDLEEFGQFRPRTVWLVMYPDPEFNGLVPAIYSCDANGTGELIELNTRLYSQLVEGDPNAGGWPSLEPVVGREGTSMDLAERIRNLVVGKDTFEIYEEWSRTAEFIKKNPALRIIEDENRRLKEFWSMKADADT